MTKLYHALACAQKTQHPTPQILLHFNNTFRSNLNCHFTKLVFLTASKYSLNIQV